MRLPGFPLLVAAAALAGLAAAGCNTQAFCFNNCTGGSGVTGDGGPADGEADTNIGLDAHQPDSTIIHLDSGGGKDACVETNGGNEICDGEDNDCDGIVDNNIDFGHPITCGNCETDCSVLTEHVLEPTCTPPSGNVGVDPGTCGYTECAPDWWDIDGDETNGCEYYCPFNPTGANTTDPGGAEGCGRDDDCDGEIDEDVNTCDQTSDCGKCGKECVILNGTADCVTTAGAGEACTEANTTCRVEDCDQGWYDIDKSPDNGCEYQCPVAVPSAEVCDGVDNDCDGKIDNKDSDLVTADPDVGDSCFGGTTGECVDPSHEGVKKCIAGAIECCDGGGSLTDGVCDTNVVLRPGDALEKCNGKDDDCDGQADDSPTDEGAVCGSSVGNCSVGSLLCVNAALDCVGDVGPVPETCNGQDDDCDGVIDGTEPASAVACGSDADCAAQAPAIVCLPRSSNPLDRICALPTADSGDASGPFACDVPPPPPPGVPQPCQAGTLACTGGVLSCQGSIVPTQGIDECGEDTNCDGQLTDQTGRTDDDVLNCGDCGNDCNALAGGVLWTCDAGSCVPNGCKNGFIDCDGNPNDCEVPCTFASSTESCNGVDDDCDCQVDENVPPQTPVQACGVSPAATDAGCTSGVAVRCVGGAWQCTFGAGYCDGGSPPSCSQTTDACDGLDNDCDGVADEGFRPPALTQGFLGQTCFSDDGVPPPGHGPCRTQGTFVCDTAGTGTECSATIDLTQATTEVCNAVDDDCDGQLDESPDVENNDPAIGVQCFGGTQGVCADPANAGTTICSSGVPLCTGSNLVRPGELPETCNGLDDDCDGQVDDSVIDAGGVCGSGVGECSTGNFVCQGGGLVCQGDTGPQPETCNGLDDDCDGSIDGNPTDAGQPCDVPPAPPAPTAGCPVIPQPCSAGTSLCIGGLLQCQGSVTPSQSTDECCEDTNCDGQLTDQTGRTDNDVLNCGTCGNDCNALGGNVVWTCNAGTCEPAGCQTGFIDCDGNPSDCERPCTFSSSTESCNGADDNCNCQVDENVPPQTPVQACGVSPAATDPGCTSGVAVACVGGAWQCTFPAGYCDGGAPPACSTTGESCDGLDNDCDGVSDEDFKPPLLTSGFLGEPCFSDDGLPPPGHGPCRGAGTYVCTADGSGTTCNAAFDPSGRGPELCNGIDDDCDGQVDESPDVENDDPAVGVQCFGGTQGVCADPANAGVTICQSTVVVCSGPIVKPGDLPETCNSKDDDCNGTVDDNPIDEGGVCGNGQGTCQTGNYVCQGGSLVCQGDVGPGPETCDGRDNDCDGTIDNNLTDTGQPCDVPVPPPSAPPECPGGVTQPCSAGTTVCTGGVLGCSGSVLPAPGATDLCCDDTDCNGVLENQPNLNDDVSNCGSCGNDCNAIAPGGHGTWACQNGSCVRTGCDIGFYDCDGNANDCEYACSGFPGATELCNGADDDCNCAVDDIDPADIPTPPQVCGTSPAASECGCVAEGTPGCSAGTGVVVACTSGSWACTFQSAGYCDGGNPASCATTNDTCDGADNNCNGNADENYKLPVLTNGYLGQPCASDDGLPPPGHGACQGTGVYVCTSPTTTGCNATFQAGNRGPELCNEVDDDCDGDVDEPFSAPGSQPEYVRPAVVRIGGGVWMFTYEASRTNATASSPGSGNGYHTSSPGGEPLEATVACSRSGVVPWFNVTPDEATQTCTDRGGRLCDTSDWTRMCQANASCTRGYNPRGNPCRTNATGTKFCNIEPYDFDPSAPGIQNGLLPTAWMGAGPPPGLQNCWTDLRNQFGNPGSAGLGAYDTMGNLREITDAGGGFYSLMGGAFNTPSEDGTACDFTFFTVDDTFRLFDTGFRCCFDSDPS